MKVSVLIPAYNEAGTIGRCLEAVYGRNPGRDIEVLIVTGTARETIRKPEGNPPLKDVMERGVHPYQMQTFEMHLRELVKAGRVNVEDARAALG